MASNALWYSILLLLPSNISDQSFTSLHPAWNSHQVITTLYVDLIEFSYQEPLPLHMAKPFWWKRCTFKERQKFFGPRINPAQRYFVGSCSYFYIYDPCNFLLVKRVSGPSVGVGLGAKLHITGWYLFRWHRFHLRTLSIAWRNWQVTTLDVYQTFSNSLKFGLQAKHALNIEERRGLKYGSLNIQGVPRGPKHIVKVFMKQRRRQPLSSVAW